MAANSIILNLNDTQALQLRELYSQRLEALRANPIVQEYESFKSLLDAIDVQLRPQGSFKQETLVTSDDVNVDVVINTALSGSVEAYDKNWPMSKKAEFSIFQKGKPLTTREIINIIEQNEPNLFKTNDFDRVQKNLASTLKQKVDKNKTFFRYKIDEGQEFYYGLIAEKDKYKSAPATQPLFH